MPENQATHCIPHLRKQIQILQAAHVQIGTTICFGKYLVITHFLFSPKCTSEHQAIKTLPDLSMVLVDIWTLLGKHNMDLSSCIIQLWLMLQGQQHDQSMHHWSLNLEGRIIHQSFGHVVGIFSLQFLQLQIRIHHCGQQD